MMSNYFPLCVTEQGPKPHPLRPDLQAAPSLGGRLLRPRVQRPQQRHGKSKTDTMYASIEADNRPLSTVMQWPNGQRMDNDD